jgi:hypothetical protein
MARAAPLDFLGGIGEIGGTGALGGLEGILAGEELRRRFQAQDIQNQMNTLNMLLTQRQMNQPTYSIHGDRLLSVPAMGGKPTVENLPMTPAEQGLYNLRDLQGQLATERADNERLRDPNRQAPQTSRSQFFGALGKKVADGTASPMEKQMWDSEQERLKRTGGGQPYLGSENRPILREHVMTGPDGKLHLYQLRSFTDPKGQTETKLMDLGLAPPQPSQVPQTTNTSGYTIQKRSEIKDDPTLKGLRRAVDDVATELAKKPSFAVSGPYVTLPDGRRLRKTDVIAEIVAQRFGAEVNITVDKNGKYSMVSAFNPEKKIPTGRSTTRGPSNQVGQPQLPPRGEPEDDEEDE